DPEPFFEINHQIKRDLALLQVLDIHPNLDRLPYLRSYSDMHADAETSVVDLTLPDSYILVNMDVSETKRQFPSQHANDLIRTLIAKREHVIFTGQQENNYLKECIQGIDDPRLINLVEKTTLDELLYLIGEAKGVISVNTGVV